MTPWMWEIFFCSWYWCQLKVGGGLHMLNARVDWSVSAHIHWSLCAHHRTQLSACESPNWTCRCLQDNRCNFVTRRFCRHLPLNHARLMLLSLKSVFVIFVVCFYHGVSDWTYPHESRSVWYMTTGPCPLSGHLLSWHGLFANRLGRTRPTDGWLWPTTPIRKDGQGTYRLSGHGSQLLSNLIDIYIRHFLFFIKPYFIFWLRSLCNMLSSFMNFVNCEGFYYGQLWSLDMKSLMKGSKGRTCMENWHKELQWT